MVTVLAIVGTRPEALKMAPIILELQSRPGVKSCLCATAQHRVLLDQVLQNFSLSVDFDLDLMRPDQDMTEFLGAALRKLRHVLVQVKPDWVLVQGDTMTALAGALAGFYGCIKLGYVEAGLRTGNMMRPFPEEANRRLVSVLASRLFAPTARARDNLIREQFSPSKIVITGNTIIDALRFMEQQLPKPPLVRAKRLLLLTAHRRENFGCGLESIFRAVCYLADKFSDIEFVYPVHPNPHVAGPAQRFLAGNPRVRLIEPLGYFDFIQQLRSAYLVLSDSGGIQEEAPCFGVPVLVLRNETERPEAVEAGCARLVGPNFDSIVEEASRLLQDESAYHAMAHVANPFGDGKASVRIVDEILN